jgi:cytochrome c peroxidase
MAASTFFWDGRASSLEEQAKQPMVSSSELGMPTYEHVIARIASNPGYKRRFEQVFGKQSIFLGTVVKAIAAYERTLVSRNSPFDRFIGGSTSAISEAQRRGWELFKGKARCITCHEFTESSPFFTDQKFHNTGAGETNHDPLVNLARQKLANGLTRESAANVLAHEDGVSELGRYNVTWQQADIGAFKTPTLRDVELTAPYMHNGSLKTLIDVLKFYNKGGKPNPYLDPDLQPLSLTDAEIGELVQFLRALTSDDVLKQAQMAKPQTRIVVPLNRR